MITQSLTLRLVTLLLLLPGSSGVAAADWLVLKDGQTVETQGAWTVEGRRITFTAMNGTLTALRTDLVDLERSEAMTARAKEPPQQPEPEPVRESTTLEVRSGFAAPATTAAEGAAPEDDGTAAQRVEDASIRVTSWDEQVVEEGSRLVGTLRNSTTSVYLRLGLDVTLLSSSGDPVATRQATLRKNWANPGEEVPFEVDFADVFAYADASFEVTGKPFVTSGGDRAATEGEGEPVTGETATTEEPPPGALPWPGPQSP